LHQQIYQFQRDFLGSDGIRVEKKSGDTSFRAHRHDYFEIILYRNCNGKCILNGSLYPIYDDCLFFLTPKDYHKIESANPEDASSVIVSFSESMIDTELLSRLAFSPLVWYAPTEEAVAAIDALYENYTNRSSMRSKKLFFALNAVLCDVVEHGQIPSGEELCISPAIAQAITVMLSDVSQGYTLEGIARECGLSASYFSNLFHKEMGRGFKEWLNDTRIEHAKRLLLESDLPILEICYECGYNTPSQFIRMFKRSTEVSPSE
jgi:AraC-like DNA-binding protein